MNKIQVLIDPITYADVFLATELCPVEVSGLAKVKQEGDNFFIFGEAIIFNQNCRSDGTLTEFDPLAHANWIREMLRNNCEQDIEQAKLWWHSHVHSKVIFSNTDLRTIDNFGNFYSEWWLHLVVNKHKELRLRFDQYKPERDYQYLDRIKFHPSINTKELKTLMEQRRGKIKEIIQSKVRIV